MADLPPVGFRAVLENSDGFQRAAAAIDKTVAHISATTQTTSEKINASLIKMESRFRDSFNKAADAVTRAHTTMKGALAKIEAAIKSTAAVISGILVGALGILLTAFTGTLSLMNRGATFEGIIDSFERLTGSINVSASALLTNLRAASRGTISDMELLRLSNIALAGATGEFATQFGENLPRVLEIAGAQARATGQDVDFLFNSLITGIKRGSPMLIDNTGLVLKIEQANRDYAESIGVTVEALTAEQRQIALLNAVLASGATAMETFGAAQDTTANKVARFQTSVTNIFDTLSRQLQPLFRALLDGVNTFLSGVTNFLSAAAPYIAAIVQMIVDALRPLFSSVEGWADSMNSGNAARAFFMGAANTFGSFLQAVITIATQIMQVISDLAQGIANFLLGSSPPPEGPLHDMDTGARATMQAFLDAISETSLEPVHRVARRVRDILANIGNLDMNRIETRFARLDQALQPFVAQLELAQAYYTRLAAPLNAALNNVNQQMDAAVMALVRGEAGSAERVRSLDEQRENIEGQLSAIEQQVQAAEMQLELAEAAQAVERARLEIAQQQLAIAQRLADLRQERIDARAQPEPEPVPEEEPDDDGGDGAGGGDEPAGGGGGAGELPELPAVGGGAADTFEELFSFDEGEIAKAGEQISKAFMEGLGAGTIANFETTRTAMEGNVTALGDAFDALPARIDQIGSTITNALRVNITNPIGTWLHVAASHFDSTQYGTFAYQVATLGTRFGTWLSQVGTAVTTEGARIGNGIRTEIVAPIEIWLRQAGEHFDPAIYGSFAYTIATLGTRFSTWLTQVVSTITAEGARIVNAIRVGIVNPIEIAFVNFARNFDPAQFGTIAYQFATLPTRLAMWLATIGTQFHTTFVLPIETLINDNILPLFAGTSDSRSIAFKINAFVTGLTTTLGQLGSQLHDFLEKPFIDKVTAVKDWLTFFFQSEEPGSLSALIDSAVDWFMEMPQRIGEALSSIGQFMLDTFIVPIVNAFNDIIDAFELFLNGMLAPLADAMDTAAGLADIMGQGQTGSALRVGAEALRGQHISLPNIPIPGAQFGGSFGPGLLRVGEHGQELISNAAQRLDVFPNSVLSALENLSANPQALPMSGAGAGGTVNNTSESNAEYNFNNLNNDAQVMQRIALLRTLN